MQCVYFGFCLFVGESSGGQQDIGTVAGSARGCDAADAAAAATVCWAEEPSSGAQPRSQSRRGAQSQHHKKGNSKLYVLNSQCFFFFFFGFRLVFIVIRLTWEILKRIKISLTSGSKNSNTGTSKVYRKETTLRNIIFVPFPDVSLWPQPLLSVQHKSDELSWHSCSCGEVESHAGWAGRTTFPGLHSVSADWSVSTGLRRR